LKRVRGVSRTPLFFFWNEVQGEALDLIPA
jgi:hypothetical protein